MSQYNQKVTSPYNQTETIMPIGQKTRVGKRYNPIEIMPQLPVMLNQKALAELIRLIAETFTVEDLRWVCAVANIDEGVLAGQNSQDQACSLVEYASRHQNDLYELLRACESESPRTNWPRWQELHRTSSSH